MKLKIKLKISGIFLLKMYPVLLYIDKFNFISSYIYFK